MYWSYMRHGRGRISFLALRYGIIAPVMVYGEMQGRISRFGPYFSYFAFCIGHLYEMWSSESGLDLAFFVLTT